MDSSPPPGPPETPPAPQPSGGNAGEPDPVPLLPRPTWLQVNGLATLFAFAAAGLAALTLFAFNAPDPAAIGAAIGWGLGILDLAITSEFLRRAVAQTEHPKTARQSGEIRVIVGGFIGRLLFLALGIIAITNRAADTVDIYGFVFGFFVTHMATIGGWGFAIQHRQKLRQKARAERKAAAAAK